MLRNNHYFWHFTYFCCKEIKQRGLGFYTQYKRTSNSLWSVVAGCNWNTQLLHSEQFLLTIMMSSSSQKLWWLFFSFFFLFFAIDSVWGHGTIKLGPVRNSNREFNLGLQGDFFKWGKVLRRQILIIQL